MVASDGLLGLEVGHAHLIILGREALLVHLLVVLLPHLVAPRVHVRRRVKVIGVNHLLVVVLKQHVRCHLVLVHPALVLLLLLNHLELLLLMRLKHGVLLVGVLYLLMWLHLILIFMILLIVFYIPVVINL